MSPTVEVVNLMAGVKASDVDMDRARAVEVRDALHDLLRDMPHVRPHAGYWDPPEQRAVLTAEEALLMRMFAESKQRAREFSANRRRAERIGVPP